MADLRNTGVEPETTSTPVAVRGMRISSWTGPELRTALDGIYQGKILAEAPAGAEREPIKK